MTSSNESSGTYQPSLLLNFTASLIFPLRIHLRTISSEWVIFFLLSILTASATVSTIHSSVITYLVVYIVALSVRDVVSLLCTPKHSTEKKH